MRACQLELFDKRAEVQLLREGRSVLGMQMPVTLGNLYQKHMSAHLRRPRKGRRVVEERKGAKPYRLGLNLAVLDAAVGDAVLAPGGVDAAVDDGEGDVDALGAELAGQRLGEGALGELAGGEGGEAGGAADGGGGAGDDEGGRTGGGGDGGEEARDGSLGEVEEAVAGEERK